MKLVFSKSDRTFEIEKANLNTIIIENETLLENVSDELYLLTNKIEDSIFIFDNGEKIELNKILKWIHSPYLIDISKKDTQKQLLKDIIGQETNRDSLYVIKEYADKIIEEIDNIGLKSDYQFEYKIDSEIEGLLKLFDVQIKNDEGTFIERLTDFIHAYYSLIGIKVFIISNCLGFLDLTAQKELQKLAQYLEITIILIDYYDKPIELNTYKTIIDHDLCEIH